MADELIEDVVQEELEESTIVTYGYKEISEIFGINDNRSEDFLKKFGVKIGHWQIEKGSLLEVLRENKGEKLI